MAELAALALKVDSKDAEKATVVLKDDFPKAASAAEKGAQRFIKSVNDAGKATDDFSKRVKRNIADIEFETAQLKRNAAERAKFAALRRAGVAEASAEGQAIARSVAALQAQKSAIEKTTESKQRLSNATNTFTGYWKYMIAAMIGAAGIGAISRASDAFVTLTNQIKVTGAVVSDVTAIQERLFAAANKNGVEIGALGTLYSRVAMAGKELGISQETLLQFTDGVTAALKVQGGSAASASGALLQLSQALGSGIVRAEEFNSILEGAKPIADAAARGMDGMNGSVAKLRTAILAGTVTSKQFFDATMKGFEETKKQAAAASMTTGQSLTALENSFINLIGQMDKMTGTSKLISGGIASISKALDQAAKDAQDPQSFTNVFVRGVEMMGNVIRANIQGLGLIFRKLGEYASEGVKLATEAFDNFNVWAAGVSAGFIEAFKGIPDALGQLFTNAWEIARTKTAAGINNITSWLNENTPDALSWLRPGKTDFDTKPRGTGPVGAGTGEAMERAAAQARADMQARIDRQKQLNRMAGMEGDENRARIGALPSVGPLGLGGGGGAAAGGKAAEDAAKKYRELTAELELTKAAQDKMTDAARKGGVAFQEQEALLQAQQKALDIFGKKLDENDPRLTKLRDLMLSISQGKIAEAFAAQTKELENQNAIIEKEIELIGQRPEIIAREIALLKAKQDAEKAGTAITQADVEARRKAIEVNETLKNQAEELRKAQELWTAPLKSALEDIQSTAAEAFEGLFQNGKLSFESLGEVFTKTLKRMAAEFLALATIRPIMNVVVNAIGGSSGGSGGILGGLLGGGSGGGGAGNILQSLGGTVLQSQGGIGGLFKGVGNWFGGLFGGGGAAAAGSVATSALAPAASSLGGAAASSAAGIAGSGGLSAAFAAIPVAGWIAAAAAIAKGILGPGDKQRDIKSSLSTLLGPSPEEWMADPARSAFDVLGPGGPVGAAILKLFGLHPFMKEPPVITNQEYGQLSYGSGPGGGFGTSGGAWGPNAQAGNLQNPLNAMGQTMQSIFDALGGVKDAAKVWGVAMESFSRQQGEWQFSNQTTFLVGPNGEKRQWGQGSGEDVGFESVGVAAAINTILGGALDVSEDMKNAVKDINASGKATFATLSEAVGEMLAFEKAIKNFGVTTTSAEQAIKAVDESFNDMYNMAAKYAVAAETVGKIDAERNRQRLLVTKEFTDNIEMGILELTDPLSAAFRTLHTARAADIVANDEFLRLVPGYKDRRLEIEKLYQLREQEILKQHNENLLEIQRQANAEMIAGAAASLTNLQSLIRYLSPGGAASGLDPRSQLAGLRASYDASYAQAAADPANSDAIARYTANAQAYIDFNRSFTGGSTGYAQSVAEALQRSQELQIGVTQNAISRTADPGTHSRLDALLVAANTNNSRTAEQNAKMDMLIDLLLRYVANPGSR